MTAQKSNSIPTKKEIICLIEDITSAENADFVSAIEAIKTRSLDTAPESFKAFLRLPENRVFAKTFR